MGKRDIVVVGASAGGMDALSSLVGHLPRDFSSAVFIAWHTAPYTRSMLPEILARASRLPVAHARHHEPIDRSRIYVAPPDHHLLVERDRVRLSRGPKENRFRPAVDPLFRSAAYAYGPRVVGVVLSGNLDDGTAGLWAIKDRGGKAIVQDPNEARHPSMPLSALQHVEVDYKLPVVKIAERLIALSAEAAEDEAVFPVSQELAIETQLEQEGRGLESGVLKLGAPSAFTCPECHGALLQIRNGSLLRFRCHTGHAYSVESLLADLSEAGERSIESALRAVQESVVLLQHLSAHAAENNESERAASLKAEAKAALKRADTLRRIAHDHRSLSRIVDRGHGREEDRLEAERPAKRANR
jgi:two-component system chemotaxis response regulator CheB